MKLYRYRDLTTDKLRKRVCETELSNRFWRSNFVKLNDPDEFWFKCDCKPTRDTAALFERLMSKHGKTWVIEYDGWSELLMNDGYLNSIATPIIEDMTGNVRREVGLVCFSRSKDKSILWEEYGGKGNGLCIEIDVPDDTKNLHKVNYVKEKVVHIDSILKSNLFDPFILYRDMLLTKRKKWEPEEEMRFVTDNTINPNDYMHIKGAVITDIVFGNKVEPDTFNEIKGFVDKQPYGSTILLTQKA